MKKQNVLLVLFLITFSLYSNSQVLRNDFDTWTTVEEYYKNQGGKIIIYHYNLGDDTIINEDNYVEVNLIVNDLNRVICFLRENDSKIYLLDTLGNEGLIYDFNLSINDTFKLYNPFIDKYNSFDVYVSDSTTLQLANEQRVKYVLSSTEFPLNETWITGIGSLRGFLHSGIGISSIVGTDPSLLCMFHETNEIYLNPDYDNCFTSTSLKDKHVGKIDCEIFPNPVIHGQQFDIKLNKALLPSRFQVINLYGKVISSTSLSSQTTNFTAAAITEEGIYLVRIVIKEEVVTKLLIVK